MKFSDRLALYKTFFMRSDGYENIIWKTGAMIGLMGIFKLHWYVLVIFVPIYLIFKIIIGSYERRHGIKSKEQAINSKDDPVLAEILENTKQILYEIRNR